MNGWPVVKYTGFNAQQVLKALRLKPGDAVVMGPDKSFVIRAEALDAVPVIRESPLLGMVSGFSG